MIFKKDVNFPYPVLTPYSIEYIDVYFSFDVDLEDNNNSYGFKLKYELTSKYLTDLLRSKQANLYLVIESQDVTFFEVNDSLYIEIPKNRITLSKMSYFQLFVFANKNFTMRNNQELDPFFDNKKSDIKVREGNVLAISNVVKFNGDLKKPFELFWKEVDETIESDIQIELSNELIKIKYKNNDMQFAHMNNQNSLNNHYVYMGLQKVLMKILFDQNKEEMDVEDLEDTENSLYQKIYNLLTVKKIQNFSFETIDKTIYQMTDRVIDKHVYAVKGLVNHES